MRYTGIIFWLAVIALMLLTACEKNETVDNSLENSVEGIYTGTLTEENKKSVKRVNGSMAEATAEVTVTGENEIRVNCNTSDFDTTFMLNFYEHHDSAYVCYTGEDFEKMYGHMLGQGHMMGGMMRDMRDGETEWMHHMDDEHDEGDEHFGGFDMDNHTFSYTFRMKDADNSYDLIFQGAKKQL